MIYLAYRNLLHRPTNTALCLALLAFGVGIITLLLLLEDQLHAKLERDLVGIDVVVGAKGSPLQLVLSAVYHLDAPTGNIPAAEAERMMRNPEVATAVPLAYGDYFGGYRILGTTVDYLALYGAELAGGRLFAEPLEVVLGAGVAQASGLTAGDTFVGQHGVAHTGETHADDAYRVVGVLRANGTVVDQLVLTQVESVWAVHDHAVDDHGGHDSYTALLLGLKRRQSLFTLPRLINEGTSLQAVLPAIEINRLFALLGVGIETLRLVARGILGLSGVSVFLVLYARLRDRRPELALLRCTGFRPVELFGSLLLEGLLLAVAGYVLGFALGLVAALLPALQAARLNISTTLARG